MDSENNNLPSDSGKKSRFKTKYGRIGIVAFIVIACSILFYFAFFEDNNFERTFASSSGDLIKDYNQDIDKVQRYTEINCNGQIWYVCNQWDKTTIDKFNEYMNSKFSKYIKIVEH